MLDRLKLTEDRIAGMAAGIREVVTLEDPIGNTDKTVNAATRQRKAIDRLIETGRFHTLPADLQEMAQARMDEPDFTLQQQD